MPHSARFTINADDVVALAQRRSALALGATPVLVVVGATFVVTAPSLTLIAVLCGFFAYAAVTTVRRQRRIAAEAASWELVLEGNRVLLPGAAPRVVVLAIDRPDYLRLMGTHQKVAAFWFDARRDPSAFIDIPLSRAERSTLHTALEAAGVPLRHESSEYRAIALVGGLGLLLSGLVIARMALRLTAVALVASPVTFASVLIALAFTVWTLRQTR